MSSGCTREAAFPAVKVSRIPDSYEPLTEDAMQVIDYEPEISGTENTDPVIPEPEIPEPERISPSDAGFHDECFSLIDEIISRDVENGFPSAELTVMRDGKIVYENAWGRVNSYYPDGERKEDSPEVTTDTLYDLASVTKMFGVNYALQKLMTEGRINLEDKVYEYIGDRFYSDVTEIAYVKGDPSDLVTQKEWKKQVTIRDLITHTAGFPADPHYCHRYFNAKEQELSTEDINPLFVGYGADDETKEATVEAICRTP